MVETAAAPPLSILQDAALFLDFDGTLVELAESPAAIAVPAGLPALLERLSRFLSGRLAIISGRAVGDLDGHLRFPGVALAGSHGLEIRQADGRQAALAPPAALADAREEIHGFARGAPGLLVEEKPVSIAIHYRQAPEREEGVIAFLSEIAARTGLGVQRGKMVAELRMTGPDKGDALRALMAEPAFAGANPVFVGDDLTDEDAFAAAAQMGGTGILVGPPRPSAARWRLDDVAAVARWLGEASGGEND